MYNYIRIKGDKMKRKKRRNKIIIFALSIILLITSIYLIHTINLLDGIEDKGRLLIVLILLVIDVYFLNEAIKAILKKKKQKHLFLIISMIIYSIINLLGALFINDIYSDIKNMNKSSINYTTVLLSKNNIKDLNHKTVGMVYDENSIDGYILAKEYIEKNSLDLNIKYYDSMSDLIKNLLEENVEYIFISENYSSILNTEEYYENNDELIVIDTYTKKINKTDEISNKNILKDPFTILFMGIDSHLEGINNQKGNGDALILLTFNPNTLSATMLSIPRDSYVKQACFANNVENKITHAAWGGSECMIKTIENFLDINIDYYVKINFKGVVSLVDALGGIYVDVPKTICTDNSSRKGQICVEKGYRKINGEQALTLSRNRHDFSGGDLDRGLHQQLVIEGIINSSKNIDSVTEITDILNIISNNIDTNFTTEEILSSYNILKKIILNNHGSNLLNLQKLYLNGEGQTIYDEGMNMKLWNYILYPESIKAVSNAMKYNLELLEPILIKDFKYDNNENYTSAIIGKNVTGKSGKYELLPNFTTYTLNNAIAWISKHGFSYKIVYEYSSTNEPGEIIKQSIPDAKRIDKITSKNIILTVAKADVSNGIGLAD